MKGVVLAGGTGSRMFPLTKITNKHLLPIYDKPMIYYPIQTLVDAGIQEILVVTGGRNSGDFLRLLANGKEFGLKHLDYTYQEGEGGIADALGLAEHFADGGPICVILGDNIIERSIRHMAVDFERQESGCQDSSEGSAGRGALRSGRGARRAHHRYRRKTQSAQVEFRGDGHLYV
jgi:glucose-1-phosphate thymidylyltransferase